LGEWGTQSCYPGTFDTAGAKGNALAMFGYGGGVVLRGWSLPGSGSPREQISLNAPGRHHPRRIACRLTAEAHGSKYPCTRQTTAVLCLLSPSLLRMGHFVSWKKGHGALDGSTTSHGIVTLWCFWAQPSCNRPLGSVVVGSVLMLFFSLQIIFMRSMVYPTLSRVIRHTLLCGGPHDHGWFYTA